MSSKYIYNLTTKDKTFVCVFRLNSMVFCIDNFKAFNFLKVLCSEKFSHL